MTTSVAVLFGSAGVIVVAVSEVDGDLAFSSRLDNGGVGCDAPVLSETVPEAGAVTLPFVADGGPLFRGGTNGAGGGGTGGCKGDPMPGT